MNKNRKRSQDEPNRASNMEKAEGSRESVRGSGNSSDSGGISNRELSREECEQDQLPERGRSESER